MSFWLLAAGTLLVLGVMVDALWTTLWVDGGAGPVSRAVMRTVRGFFGLVAGRARPLVRSIAGPAMLIGTLVTWILLLWAGWLLIFLAEPGAVVQTSTGLAAGLAGRAYFVGYTIFTLGNGDFQPVGSVWQVLTAIAAGSGLVLVTLGITYLLSVLSAHVAQRTAAAIVLNAASDPVTLVAKLRGDGEWPELHSWARMLTMEFSRTTDQHLAYPVLHFLSGASRAKSPAVAVAVVDEALTLIRHGLREEARPTGFSLDALSAALKSYVGVMQKSARSRRSRGPPPPDLAGMAEMGIPVVSRSDFEAEVARKADHRRRLVALVESSGWSWPARE